MNIYSSFLRFFAGSTQEQQEATARALGLSVERVLQLANSVDPTPEKRFETWLLKQMKFKNIRLPEDGSRVLRVLTDFVSLSNNRQIEQRDIHRYPRIHDLEEAVWGIQGRKISTQPSEEVRRVLELPGVSLVAESSSWVIVKIEDPQSASKLASGTEWCTSDSATARFYIPWGLYIIYRRIGSKLKKFVQFTGDFSQFMDVHDSPLREVSDDLFEMLDGLFTLPDTFYAKNVSKLVLQVTKIKNWPGKLNLSRTKVSQLPSALSVGLLDVSFCENLQHLPENLYVKLDLIATGSGLVDLPKGLHVQRRLDVSHTSISMLPEDLVHFGELNLGYTPIERLPEGRNYPSNLNLNSCKRLEGLPNNLSVNGDLYLNDVNFLTLPENLTVGGTLCLNNVRITALPLSLKARHILGKNLQSGQDFQSEYLQKVWRR